MNVREKCLRYLQQCSLPTPTAVIAKGTRMQVVTADHTLRDLRRANKVVSTQEGGRVYWSATRTDLAQQWLCGQRGACQ